MFFHFMSMGVINPHSTGCGQFGSQGLDWQDLCCGALNVARYQKYVVSEKKIFKVSPKISL